MANPQFKMEAPRRALAKGEFYANGILMNRKYNLPEDKVVVRDKLSGKLIALDRAKDFKPDIHEVFDGEVAPVEVEPTVPSDPVPETGAAVPPLDDISYEKAHYELLKQKGWTKLAGTEREAYKSYKEKFGS